MSYEAVGHQYLTMRLSMHKVETPEGEIPAVSCIHYRTQYKLYKSIHNESGRQTHQTVLLPVVQPMACPSCADDSLKLVGFHPNDFIDTLVTERRKKNQIKSNGFPGENDVLMVVDAQQERLTPKD